MNGSRRLVEIVSAYRGDAFRTMYTVQLAETVYVLHAFQKNRRPGAQRRRAKWNWFDNGSRKPNGLQRRGDHEKERL